MEIARWLLKMAVLPPVPFLLLLSLGLFLIPHRRRLAVIVLLFSAGGLYFTATVAGAKIAQSLLLQVPAPLGWDEIARLRGTQNAAIVILGGGRRAVAPEYKGPSLNPRSIERLRYGLWLAKQTALPVMFSGGLSPNSEAGPGEASIAAIEAERDFGHPLRWVESQSRNTRENAQASLALLSPEGIRTIVLVTHGYHMSRAIRSFQRADTDSRLTIIAAPMGLMATRKLELDDWLPSPTGFEANWTAFYEWLGLLSGA